MTHTTQFSAQIDCNERLHYWSTIWNVHRNPCLDIQLVASGQCYPINCTVSLTSIDLYL